MAPFAITTLGIDTLNLRIRAERHEDLAAIRRVNSAAFGGDDESNLVDSLRDGGYVVASHVAEVDQVVVGHILFSPVSIDCEAVTKQAVSLAPMAVMPQHQRMGIGSKLVAAGLQECRDQGHTIAVVLGHPEFYARFGFRPQLAQSLKSPFGGGDAWMALELVSGALTGVAGTVNYATPFGMLQ